MGFAGHWIHLLLSCVRTVTYSILINWQPHGKIVPSRGVRQGDLLSLYFFIICVEAMSSMLHQSIEAETISGISISRGGININHLFFADDSVLFCRANLWEWGKIREILDCYEAASGQKINREKTSFFVFSYFPAVILNWRPVLFSKESLGLLLTNNMRLILVFQLWWEDLRLGFSMELRGKSGHE